MNKYYKTLELDKVLLLLAGECANETSKRLALAVEPSTDIYTVRREIDKASFALDMTVRYGMPIFYNISDIQGSVSRAASGAALSLKELIEIKKVLQQINALCDWYRQCADKDNPLDYLFGALFPDKYLENRLDSCIIDEDTLSDDASPQLRSIRRKIASAGSRIRETLDKMIRSSSVQKYLQDAIVTVRDGRYVLPVRTEFKGQISGLVHDSSASGSTLFIEPMAVVEANNDIRILKGQESDEINRIIRSLSADCGAAAERLISGASAAAELDLYFAKAQLGAKMNACRPEINQECVTLLKKARHPLLDPKTAVPIDFSIGKEYDSLVITGPNTGGKTVVLKTVGLLTLMTMCGMLIPASDGSRISVYDNILADIGDRQSIEQSLSTFSAHMNGVKEIIEKADGSSLILLDELGSGTDPVEGAALAVAIIERLRTQGATVVTTTHYQELKMYALDTDGVENASCEFDVSTLRPTYRLITGMPGKSNAFEISRRLGIDEEIIDSARSMISDDNRRFEKILDELEQTRSRLEEDRLAARADRQECERLRKELEEERKKFAVEKESELEKARLRSADIINRVQRESQQLVDELDRLRKEKDSEDFSRRAIEARQKQKSVMNKMYLESNPVTETPNDDYVLPRPLKKGDSVIMTDSGRKAIVITPPDGKGNCFVQAGVMKTRVDVSKLRLVEKQQPVKTPKKKSAPQVSLKGVESRMTRQVRTELDIRGYAADDGIYEVDSFLDSAVLSGITMVTIIHGKGTGVLKNAVRNHLKHHPHVKSSRKGLYGEGEDGVTVVELK